MFGKEVLDYSLNLCQGKFDLLVRMPDNIILQIFSFLDLDDIGQLSKTCKKFQKVRLQDFFLLENITRDFKKKRHDF